VCADLGLRRAPLLRVGCAQGRLHCRCFVPLHDPGLVLNTDTALAKFTKGEREWELGVDGSVAVAKINAGGDLDTTNLKKDIVSFIFGSKGLIADATWEESRFKKLDVEEQVTG
jgi:lipid-binding SYLF domain-containing protein